MEKKKMNKLGKVHFGVLTVVVFLMCTLSVIVSIKMKAEATAEAYMEQEDKNQRIKDQIEILQAEAETMHIQKKDFIDERVADFMYVAISTSNYLTEETFLMDFERAMLIVAKIYNEDFFEVAGAITDSESELLDEMKAYIWDMKDYYIKHALREDFTFEDIEYITVTTLSASEKVMALYEEIYGEPFDSEAWLLRMNDGS